MKEIINVDIQADKLNKIKGIDEDLDKFVEMISTFWVDKESRISTIYAKLNDDMQPEIVFTPRFTWKNYPSLINKLDKLKEDSINKTVEELKNSFNI
jgi:hypothetical protein